jgi:hypothetical protein
MSKEVLKVLENAKGGALICVDWCDASTGKSSLNGGIIDVPVKSWGVYLGLIGSRIKHIILAQNSFRFTEAMFDMDYTAIPVGWVLDVRVIEQGHLPEQVVADLVRSFVSSGNQNQRNTSGLRSPRIFQHRMQRLSAIGRRN